MTNIDHSRTATAHEPSASPSSDTIQSVVGVIGSGSTITVLSGAGCSTASGLGDYRDKAGQWKRAQPITGQVFLHNQAARHRYWARSAVGWPAFSKAKPNQAHTALAALEQAGVVSHLITQNVDQLHQRAGHKAVIDLHGVLASVSCANCAYQQSRDAFQIELLKANPWLSELNANYAPDGDADLQTDSKLLSKLNNMRIPACPECRPRGIMKPDVVFFW